MSRTELPGVPSVPVRMSKETTIGGRMRYRLLIAGSPVHGSVSGKLNADAIIRQWLAMLPARRGQNCSPLFAENFHDERQLYDSSD